MPDAAVAEAIDRIQKQSKFKRMMMFGLRALSELCIPPTNKYKENSLAALEAGIVTTISNAMKLEPADEDLGLLGCRIYFGMTEALKAEGSDELTRRFVDEGAVDAIVLFLSAPIKDDDAITIALKCINNTAPLKVKVDAPLLATSITKLLERAKPKNALQLMSTLRVVVTSSRDAAVKVAESGIPSILEYCMKLKPTDKDSFSIVEQALKTIKEAASSGKADPENVKLTMKLMDMYKTKKTIADEGSSAMAAMLGPEQLKKCLDTLSTAPDGSQQKNNALVMLSSMSYINSYAETVVKSGALTLLCEAVKKSSAVVAKGVADPIVIAGLTGACKMLAAVSRDPQHIQAVEVAGGLQAAITGIASVKNHPEAAAACCATLAAMSRIPLMASQLIDAGTISIVLELITNNINKADVTHPAVGVLVGVSSHESLIEKLSTMKIIPVLTTIMKTSKSLELQVDCITAIQHLSSAVTACATLQEDGSFQLMVDAIKDHGDNLALAQAASAVFAKLSALSDNSVMATPNIVDATLGLMLTHPGDRAVQNNCKETLEVIATPNDVTRTLNDLERAVMAANTTPARSYNALAAVGGLSQISRLRPIFEKQTAAETVLKGIEAWIGGPAFKDRQQMISKALQCVLNLHKFSSGKAESVLEKLMHCCISPQMKGILDKQEPADNTVLDLVHAIQTLISSSRIETEAGVTSTVESMIKIMKKFQESHVIQVVCIDILNLLVSAPKGTTILSETGALKLVLAYMQKVSVYEDVQVAGFRFLSNVLQVDPSMADVMKRHGGGELTKTASRTHGKSKNVGPHLSRVAAILMAEDDLEVDITSNIATVTQALEKQDFASVHRALCNLNASTVSVKGNRIATRLGLGTTVLKVAEACTEARKQNKLSIRESLDLLTEISSVMKRAAGTRMGCTSLLQANGMDALSACIDDLMIAPDCEAKRKGLEDCATAMHSLVKFGRIQDTEAHIKKGMIQRMLKVMDLYPGDPGVFGAACTALAPLRGPAVTNNKDYNLYLDKIMNGINSGDIEHRLQCSAALVEILQGPQPGLLEALSKKSVINSLLKSLDAFADDRRLWEKTLDCLNEVTKVQKLRDSWALEFGDAGLVSATAIVRNFVQRNRTDPDSCAIALAVLRRLCDSNPKATKSTLRESGIINDIQFLLSQHPDHQALSKAAGDILQKVGSDDLINHLMRQVIDTVNKGATDWQKQLASLCKELGFYLNAGIDSPSVALALAPQCADALANALKNVNVATACAISAVSRRLVVKFEADPQSPYGAKAVAPHLMGEMARVLTGLDINNNTVKNKEFICNALATLSVCLLNANTRKSALETVNKNNLLAKCDVLLNVYGNDPEVISQIFHFKASVASDADGCNTVLTASATKSKGGVNEPILEDILSTMTRNRKDSEVVRSGIEYLRNLLDAQNAPKISDQYLKSVGALCESSPECQASFIGLQGRRIGHISNEEAIINLKKAVEKWNSEEGTMTFEQKAVIAVSIAEMIGTYAERGLMDELKKCGVVDIVSSLLQGSEGSVDVFRAITKCSLTLAQDGDIGAKLVRQIGDIYMEQAVGSIKGDPILAHEVLKLLQTFCDAPGSGQILGQSLKLKELLDQIALLTASAEPSVAMALKDDVLKLTKKVKDDTPLVLTLKTVFEKWTARLAAGETLVLEEATAILPQFDFVVDFTEECSKQAHTTTTTDLASEFMYGCKCLQLLHKYAQNSRSCIDKNTPSLLVSAIKTQHKNELVCQEAINASSEACLHESMAKAYRSVPVQKVAAIIADALNLGRTATGVSDVEREAMLIPRLLLVERVCGLDRGYFNNTVAMKALIGVWDDCEGTKYTTNLLRHAFRCMRSILNENFLPIILERHVPKRLIDVVENKNTDKELLPDVLFLLGTLASIPSIKTMIGDLGGNEACLDLLRRCLKAAPTQTNSRIQTNCCLALANFLLGHPANVAKFVAAKGPETNVEAMFKSMEKTLDYDVCNGASILMCNCCFKLDEQKQLYAQKNAPSATMHTIKKYNGSDDPAALRCLNSIFKAIGNLALYTPNITEYLNQNLEQTLVHFYTHCQKTPDHIIESSLRTLSNLVLENTEEAMTRFSVLTVPLLEMLRQGRRDTPSMLSMCFETLGCLCRNQRNSKLFAANRGIVTVLKILNNQVDETLYYQGIFVLGTQSTNPASIDILVSNGVFDFIVTVFEQQLAKTVKNDAGGAMATELVVQALRCVRRLTTTHRIAAEFIHSGGANVLCQLLGKTSEHAMIHLEAARLMVCLLELNPPPKRIPVATVTDDDWDAEVPDEGVLPACALLDRPPSPRSWEAIGLRPAQITDLIVSLCTILSREGNVKILRLARFGLGLIAYFACEKIDGVLDSFYNANLLTALEVDLKTFMIDPDITQTCCYIINNVAFTSDPMMYSVLRREKGMRANLLAAIKCIPRGEQMSFCLLTEKLLNEKSMDSSHFEVHQQWDYPFALTSWKVDPYPNGVQDLLPEMREEVRTGGQFKIVLDERTRDPFHWKASFDMLQFTWRIDAKDRTGAQLAVTISRVKTISKGMASQTFQRINERLPVIQRFSEGHCCVIVIPPSQAVPEGAELNILCSGTKQRDRFVALMCEWREAASFGF